MSATKSFVLAAFLLASVSADAQSVRKAHPPEGLRTSNLQGATLQGPSLPLAWPFPPREPAARPAPSTAPSDLAPLTKPEVRTLEPLPDLKPDPGELYFLLKPNSVETDDGIIGLKPGTKVHKQPDGSYLSSGVKLTLADTEVTNDPELARPPGTPDPAPRPAVREPGHARIGATFEDFRRTPNLQWLGGSLFQLGSYSVMAVFHDNRCQELTFADLVQDTTTNHVLRDAKRSSGQYHKFFQAILDANAGGSNWIDDTMNPKFPKWHRADGALKAEATNTEANSGIITLTTSELAQHRRESPSDIQRTVLEGL